MPYLRQPNSRNSFKTNTPQMATKKAMVNHKAYAKRIRSVTNGLLDETDIDPR